LYPLYASALLRCHRFLYEQPEWAWWKLRDHVEQMVTPAQVVGNQPVPSQHLTTDKSVATRTSHQSSVDNADPHNCSLNKCLAFQLLCLWTICLWRNN
jgi:hypothetical protein